MMCGSCRVGRKIGVSLERVVWLCVNHNVVSSVPLSNLFAQGSLVRGLLQRQEGEGSSTKQSQALPPAKGTHPARLTQPELKPGTKTQPQNKHQGSSQQTNTAKTQTDTQTRQKKGQRPAAQTGSAPPRQAGTQPTSRKLLPSTSTGQLPTQRLTTGRHSPRNRGCCKPASHRER